MNPDAPGYVKIGMGPAVLEWRLLASSKTLGLWLSL